MKIDKARTKILEGDLTPMIDMTFLLIAFFMLIINFSEVEKDQDLELPDSKVARAPDEPPDHQIVLNLKMNEEGKPRVNFSGINIVGIENIGPFIQKEINTAAAAKVGLADIKVIIRADRTIPTGRVQDLIAKCQEYKLQRFALRAKDDIQ